MFFFGKHQTFVIVLWLQRSPQEVRDTLVAVTDRELKLSLSTKPLSSSMVTVDRRCVPFSPGRQMLQQPQPHRQYCQQELYHHLPLSQTSEMLQLRLQLLNLSRQPQNLSLPLLHYQWPPHKPLMYLTLYPPFLPLLSMLLPRGVQILLHMRKGLHSRLTLVPSPKLLS